MCNLRKFKLLLIQSYQQKKSMYNNEREKSYAI